MSHQTGTAESVCVAAAVNDTRGAGSHLPGAGSATPRGGVPQPRAGGADVAPEDQRNLPETVVGNDGKTHPAKRPPRSRPAVESDGSVTPPQVPYSPQSPQGPEGEGPSAGPPAETPAAGVGVTSGPPAPPDPVGVASTGSADERGVVTPPPGGGDTPGGEVDYGELVVGVEPAPTADVIEAGKLAAEQLVADVQLKVRLIVNAMLVGSPAIAARELVLALRAAADELEGLL